MKPFVLQKPAVEINLYAEPGDENDPGARQIKNEWPNMWRHMLYAKVDLVGLRYEVIDPGTGLFCVRYDAPYAIIVIYGMWWMRLERALRTLSASKDLVRISSKDGQCEDFFRHVLQEILLEEGRPPGMLPPSDVAGRRPARFVPGESLEMSTEEYARWKDRTR